jgi:hypothetical protein
LQSYQSCDSETSIEDQTTAAAIPVITKELAANPTGELTPVQAQATKDPQTTELQTADHPATADRLTITHQRKKEGKIF